MKGIFSQSGIEKLSLGMDTASMKNRVVAENIANIDTPGFKSKDIKFHNVMKEYLGEGKKLPLSRTNEKHLPPSGAMISPATFVYQQNNPSVRNDGNDVNVDYEMSQLAENNVRYQMLSQITAGKFTKLKSAIQGR